MPGAQSSEVLAVQKGRRIDTTDLARKCEAKAERFDMHLDNKIGNSVSPKREAIDPGGFRRTEGTCCRCGH
jgi:hypothetical protein